MKRAMIGVLLALAGAAPVLGATYAGLTPGVSTRAAADTALGSPLQILSGGRTLAYDPAGHDLKALSVRLGDDGQTVAVIKLTFLKPYAAAQVRQWFSLGEPDECDNDLLGRRSETYAVQGIMLHFADASPDASVTGLSHIAHPAAAGEHPVASKPAPPYLGLILPQSASDGLHVINTITDSPAASSGLQMGDEILMVDGRDATGGELSPEGFVELVSAKAAHTPLDLRIRRGERVFDLSIPLAALDRPALEARRQDDYAKAQVVYKQAAALKDKQDYAAAAPLYARAIELDPRGNNSYTYLALCHHRLGCHAAAEPLLRASLGLADGHYPRYLLGTVLSAQKRYAEAARALEHAIELREPGWTKIFDHEELGDCYLQLGRFSEARRTLLAGHQINPGRHRCTYLLAESNDRLGRREDAAYYYQRYLDFNPADGARKDQARRRLAALKPAPTPEAGRSSPQRSGEDALIKGIFKAIDGVTKEIQEFNRD